MKAGIIIGASYIIDAARTPRGRGIDKGALSGVHPQELFAQVLTNLQRRLRFEARDVDDVIAACVSQVGEQGAITVCVGGGQGIATIIERI